jgi:hypothetical protein
VQNSLNMPKCDQFDLNSAAFKVDPNALAQGSFTPQGLQPQPFGSSSSSGGGSSGGAPQQTVPNYAQNTPPQTGTNPFGTSPQTTPSLNNAALIGTQTDQIVDPYAEAKVVTKTAGTTTLQLIAKPKLVLPGTQTKIGWRARNAQADSCTLRGPEASSRKSSGVITLTPTESGTYTLTCTAKNGTSISVETTITIATE